MTDEIMNTYVKGSLNVRPQWEILRGLGRDIETNYNGTAMNRMKDISITIYLSLSLSVCLPVSLECVCVCVCVCVSACVRACVRA